MALLEGTPQGNLWESSFNGQDDRTSIADSGTSGGEIGRTNEPNGETGGRGRTTQSGRPDGLGVQDGEYQGQSRGNSSD